jgi:hypothetical protein
MSLPLAPEAAPVRDGSSPDEGPLTQTELPERVSVPSPVSRKDVSIVHRQIEVPIRQVSTRSKSIATVPTDKISAAVGGLPDIHLLTVTGFQRVETMNPSEKSGLSIDMSEFIIFLVVGIVFLLVQISMRRPAKSSPDTGLAKLLHTRPWR